MYNLNERMSNIYWECKMYYSERASSVYKPKLSIDGNMWCALYGDNLQDGVSGFGASPEKAYEDFDKNWAKEIQ
jgi:hypothetical protein